MSTNTSNVTAIVNAFIAGANASLVLSGCPSGPLTSLSTSCLSTLNWNGVEGNKTTAGYYTEYNAQITNVYNPLNVEIMSLVQVVNTGATTPQTYTTSFTANYLQDMSADFTATGTEAVYIPQYNVTNTTFQTGATCQTCWNTCVCGSVIQNINGSTATSTWTSTYDAAPHIPYTTTGTATLLGCVMNGRVSFTVALQQPSGGILQPPIYISNPALPPKFYIYTIEFKSMSTTYTSSDVYVQPINGLAKIPISISPQVSESLVSELFDALEIDLNALISLNVYQIINT